MILTTGWIVLIGCGSSGARFVIKYLYHPTLRMYKKTLTSIIFYTPSTSQPG